MAADNRAARRVIMNGGDLTIEQVVTVARDPRIRVECDPEAMARVQRAFELVEAVVADYSAALAEPEAEQPAQDYGITTGFGEFKAIPVAPEDLHQLQVNLLLSHATGVGESPDEAAMANYYSAEIVRATQMLRVNTFLRGNSGVSPELVDVLTAMLNRGVIPLVPLRGSVGSSGDLAPLAHLFGVLLGNGSFYEVVEPADLTAAAPAIRPAGDLAAVLGRPVDADRLIGPKTGLALTNGAAVSAAMLALAVHDAELLADAADAAVALTLEAICGSARAFDPAIHEARPHPAQIASAANIRALIRGSRQIDGSGEVQDVYSVRCAPQVHGASRQAIRYGRDVARIEINASTDNPLLFPDLAAPWDRAFEANRPPAGKVSRAAFSAGNFHGQPVALAADFLGIAVAELADVAERRTQMLLDSHHNRNLPPNLVALPGLNCGLMIAQYAAASLVSENKVLGHPASVDSIPTSANTEDHVSMANIAGRKALRMLANAQAVVAIELMTAAQAIDWRVGMAIPPLTGPEAGHQGSRSWREVWDAHRGVRGEFAAAAANGGLGAVPRQLGAGTAAVYGMLRAVIRPLVDDRPLDADIRSAWRLVRDGRISALIHGLVAAGPDVAAVGASGTSGTSDTFGASGTSGTDKDFDFEGKAL
ncbi:histidine ammonia-lyase [Catenulispora yoronensis]|uniref:Histidine ammonia-lyase n=1 Tax=Catenulispora yoronensis TaxID=450799 RepID=A0ABN2UM67_9ACTN